MIVLLCCREYKIRRRFHNSNTIYVFLDSTSKFLSVHNKFTNELPELGSTTRVFVFKLYLCCICVILKQTVFVFLFIQFFLIGILP